MTSASLGLRIVAIFATFAASLLGVAVPLLATKENKMETPYFKCMKACGAGVILGVAMMHLLPEGHEGLESVYPDYPLAYALTCVGVVLVLFIEQSVMILNESQNVKMAPHHAKSDTRPHTHAGDMEHNEDCGFVNCDCEGGGEMKEGGSKYSVAGTGVELTIICEDENNGENLGACVHDDHHCHSHSHEHHNLGLSKLVKTSNVKDIVSIYAMEFSIAMHSVIIGVDIGLLSSSSELVTLVSLMIAISFHQFVEGFSVGTSLSSDTGHTLGNTKIMVFIFIFAVTVPLGIIVGICTSELEETDTDVIAKGAANAVAAGTLIYISLAEMISEYFEANDLKSKPTVKICMLLSLALGAASMAVLANWA